MSLFIYYQIALLILALIYILLESKMRHYQTNRWILLFIPVLPLISYFYFGFVSSGSFGISQSYVGETLNTITTLTDSTEINSVFTLSEILIYLYTFGVLISLAYHLKCIYNTISLRRKFDQQHLIEGVSVHYSMYPDTFSFFKFIHINLNLKSKDEVLKHELVHAKQYHTIDNLIYIFYKSACWFNPAVYLLNNQVKLNHECIADSIVVKTSDRDTYLNQLLNIHFGTSSIQFINQFNNQKFLKMRLKKLNQNNQKKSNRHYLIMALTGLIIAGGAMAFSTTNVSSTLSKTEQQLNGKGEVDKMPEFKGGQEALMKYMISNLKYPKSAQKEGVEGKVMVEFTVTKTGSIEQVKALNSLNAETDAEAIRVVKSMPNWTPGEKDGKKVGVKMVLPIMFKLSDK